MTGKGAVVFVTALAVLQAIVQAPDPTGNYSLRWR